MTAILRAIGLAALAATASATQVLAAQQAGHRLSMVRGRGFVRSFEFEHKLRICNAYAFEQPLHIFQGEKKKLTGEEPLAYKETHRRGAAGAGRCFCLETRLGRARWAQILCQGRALLTNSLSGSTPPHRRKRKESWNLTLG